MMSTITQAFFKTLTDDEWKEIFDTGRLNHKLTKRLWALEDRPGKMPESLAVYLNREDFMRSFPAKKDMM
jgi:hypothetical protein